MASVSKRKRLMVYDKNDGKCVYCDKTLKSSEEVGYNSPDVFEVDHLNPKSKGGSLSDYKNLVPSCKRCNMAKGPQFLMRWLEKVDNRIIEAEQEIKWLKKVSKNINKRFRKSNG